MLTPIYGRRQLDNRLSATDTLGMLNQNFGGLWLLVQVGSKNGGLCDVVHIELLSLWWRLAVHVYG